MSIYRTFLFAPGNHPRRVEKALSLDADAVILDLEDACPIAEKVATRAVVVAACQKPRAGLALHPRQCHDDGVRLRRHRCRGAERRRRHRPAEGRGGRRDRAAPTGRSRTSNASAGLPVGTVDLIPIIETAKGLANIRAIASAGTRVKRIAFGAGDFTLDLNMTWTRARPSCCPTAASACWPRGPPASRRRSTRCGSTSRTRRASGPRRDHVKGLGFQGKMCIHPDQVRSRTRCSPRPPPRSRGRARRSRPRSPRPRRPAPPRSSSTASSSTTRSSIAPSRVVASLERIASRKRR